MLARGTSCAVVFVFIYTLTSWVGFCAPVEAAPTVVDLTSPGASQKINGVIFEEYTGTSDASPWGTTFLVIRKPNTEEPYTEEGYNTDGAPLPLDAKQPANTNALLLSDVPVVEHDGILYREFLLDISERNAGDQHYLSLDDLMIALNTEDDLTDDVATVFASPIYTLDTSSDDYAIKLDDALSDAAGLPDLVVLVPNDWFPSEENPYVYLYSKLGETFGADDGAEKWGVGVPEVPAPAPLLLAGFGISLVAALRHKRMLKS